MIDENEQFFVSESIRHARTLPFCQACTFLRGMRAAIGKDHAVAKYLGEISRSLEQTDEQLEFLSLGGRKATSRRSSS